MAILNLQTPGVYIQELKGDTNPAAKKYKPLVQAQQYSSLPSFCQKVWDNDANYIQLARYNQLNKFRNLKPSVQLVFPPIIDPK
jgi:hypothetical protein